MGKVEEALDKALSDLADELSTGSGHIKFADFDLLNKTKEKLVMACAAMIARRHEIMTDEERELVQKLSENCREYVNFIAERRLNNV